MLRCVPPARAGLGVAALALALTLPVAAQTTTDDGAAPTPTRPFPATALRGELQFGQPPEVQLNGQPARLAPGARIRGENNMLVLSGALMGSKAVANYTLDMMGNVKDVWILTAAERAKKPWPRTLDEAQQWRFDPASQTWSKP
jgi:hypothetical protein